MEGRLTKADYETLAKFRYTLRRFLRFSEQVAAEVGLTPQQHQALLAIKGFPGRDSVTNGELAERLQIRHHSAVGLVNRLVAQGLLVRERGHRDRREVLVTLTRRGMELLEKLTAGHEAELARVGPQLEALLRQVAKANSR